MILLAEWITATVETIAELAGKVYPTLGPVDAMAPYAVYGVIHARGLAGDDGGSERLDGGTFQVSIYATEYPVAWGLARDVQAAMKLMAPDGKLYFSAFNESDLGRETGTNLVHVAVRVDYEFAYQES